MNQHNVRYVSKKTGDFLEWYDVFIDTMRKALNYKGVLEMEPARKAFETGYSPTEYAERVHSLIDRI